MQIEVVCVGADFYGPIEAAIRNINAIQDEFVFRAAPEFLRAEGVALIRERYNTDELFVYLDGYRARRGAGSELYVFAFVSKHLTGNQLGNIFGTSRGSSKAAVATTYQYQRYAQDVKRFCSYYLLRYSLSFCNSAVKSHDLETDRDCYFHKKMRKSDIAFSMKSGRICDACRRSLNLSTAQTKAFQAIADFIRGQYPHALVMKGGGIKGLAYAGALQELEKHFKFDVFAGTSAGAVAAVLLAAKVTSTELMVTLQQTSFDKFLDRCWRWPLNLLFGGGLHSGDPFKDWVQQQLATKITKQGNIQLKDLPKRAILYACSPGRGTIVFDSGDTRRDTDAAVAVRISMSIPFFFVPERFEGYSIYDGGLRHNFPVSRFVADHPTTPFVALYLQSDREPRKRWFRLFDLYDVWMEGDEREVVDRYAEGVAIIDPRPVRTTDFSLTNVEKELLIKAGRLAALKLIRTRNMDDEASDSEITALSDTVDALRAEATSNRGKRRRLRALKVILILVVTYGYFSGSLDGIWLEVISLTSRVGLLPVPWTPT